MTDIPANDLELMGLCCKALDEKQAKDIRILKLGPQSSVTDYFIIATATSTPHLRALKGALDQVLHLKRGNEGVLSATTQSGWLVVDAIDFVVHLFTQEQRERYSLESLWRDCEVVDLNRLPTTDH